MTVEEICRQAGVAKATFYKSFPNKVALLHRIHDDMVDEGFARFDEIDGMDIPYPEKIERMGRWKAEFASRFNPDFFGDLIDLEHGVEAYKRRYLGNIEAAQQAGHIRGDIDPEFLWLVLEKLGELHKETGWREVLPDPGELQRQLRTLIWYGLLQRTGQ